MLTHYCTLLCVSRRRDATQVLEGPQLHMEGLAWVSELGLVVRGPDDEPTY